jgi:RHS repeat-associated protein
LGYDALNRRIAVTDALQGVTEYRYDGRDNVVAITDPTGLRTRYTYDGLNHLLETDSPDTGTTSARYDTAGNRLSSTDARGVTARFAYDALNRLTVIDYPGTAEDLRFLYDAQSTAGLGRLTRVWDASGVSAYYYYTNGKLYQETTVRDGVRLWTRYHYTAARQVSTLTYPSGRQVRYTYDTAGRVSAVATTFNGATTVLASGVRYQPFGPLKRLTFGNGLALIRDHDRAYRLSAQTTGALQDLSYAYDAGDKLTALTALSSSQHFTYDALQRLWTADAPESYGRLSYEYDAVGNRLSAIHNSTLTQYHYPPDSHRLAALTGTLPFTFQYNLSGNTTHTGRFGFNYGNDRRLKTVTQDGVTLAQYRYDYQGRRVKKTLGGQRTFYHYDQAGHLLAETDAQGATLKEYAYLEDLPLAMITPSGIYYYHTDHLGTPQFLTDSNQTVVWQADYEPFGQATVVTQGVVNNLRFPGQYFDQETGLHYNYFRDYDPTLGRYIESDPIGLAGGINTYAYVGGKPVSFADPDGLAAVIPVGPVPMPLPPVFIPGTTENKAFVDFTMKGIDALSDLFGKSDPMEMAKGGKQKGENEFTREAKSEAQMTGKDPCDIIAEWLAEAKRAGDKATVRKLEEAEKYLDCRNKRKRCE